MSVHRTVQRGDWEFWIEERPDGIFVSVPDLGGMTDMLPRVPEQLAWTEAAVAAIPDLDRVWATTWRVPPQTWPRVEALLRGE